MFLNFFQANVFPLLSGIEKKYRGKKYLCFSEIILEMYSTAFKLTCFIFLLLLLLVYCIKGQPTSFFPFLKQGIFMDFFFFHKNILIQRGGPAA